MASKTRKSASKKGSNKKEKRRFSVPADAKKEPPQFPSPMAMSKKDRKMYLEMIVEEHEGKDMAVFDDFDDCLLYYAEDEMGNPQAVYCYEDLVESFALKNNTTYIEAMEFIDYNTMRTIPYMTHVGDIPTTPPLIIYRVNRDYTTLDKSYFEKEYSDD